MTRRSGSTRHAALALAASATLGLLAGCENIMMMGGKLTGGGTATPSPQQHQYFATADQYKAAVDRRVMERNPGTASSTLQSMLRSVVVLAFTVDGDGRVVHASVYRTNGDDEVEAAALNSLRRAAPLPPPPAALLDRRGQVDLMESWLFNTDGRFQLRSLSAGQ
jgi:periplasmic protein TonB